MHPCLACASSGPYSAGKTSFIRYIVGRDFPGMNIGGPAAYSGVGKSADRMTKDFVGKTSMFDIRVSFGDVRERDIYIYRDIDIDINIER